MTTGSKLLTSVRAKRATGVESASTPPPVQVLYVLKRFPRLSETFVLREILALEAAGVRVWIDSLSPRENEPVHPELADLRAEVRYIPSHPSLAQSGMRRAHLTLFVRHPLRWSRLAARARREHGWRRFLQAGLVAERVRREGIGHIHAHFATAATQVATIAARLAGVTCSTTAHAKDIYHHDNAAQLTRRTRTCTTVVSVSQANVDFLRHQLGAQADVRLIRNGVAVQAPADPGRGASILCVARLVPKKGIDVLLRAAALLLPQHPELVIEIIGTGPLLEELLALHGELDLGDAVRFRGIQTSDQVAAAMTRARVVTLPCRIDDDGDRDGMPTVLVEALARAVPVVAGDVAGVRELVRHGRTGLLVPPEDPAALAGALGRLLRDPVLARELGANGRELVAAAYRPQEASRRLISIFSGSTVFAGPAVFPGSAVELRAEDLPAQATQVRPEIPGRTAATSQSGGGP